MTLGNTLIGVPGAGTDTALARIQDLNEHYVFGANSARPAATGVDDS